MFRGILIATARDLPSVDTLFFFALEEAAAIIFHQVPIQQWMCVPVVLPNSFRALAVYAVSILVEDPGGLVTSF